jgi:hypothetical protein
MPQTSPENNSRRKLCSENAIHNKLKPVKKKRTPKYSDSERGKMRVLDPGGEE